MNSSGHETLQIHTVPSTWLSEITAARYKQPYRRIVGIGIGTPVVKEYWSRMGKPRAETHYDKNTITTEELMVPEEIGVRLVGFFKRYFVEKAPMWQMSIKGKAHTLPESYNCHRFGYWMEGNPVARSSEVPDWPNHIAEQGMPITEPLELGQHGVVTSREELTGQKIVHHSVVGLGKNRDECLQVLASAGFIGIDTYTNILKFHERYTVDDLQVYKLAS